MKYIVYWQDKEADRYGTPPIIEAGSPVEAYAAATEQLSAAIPSFAAGHIEMLMDERGKQHNPDVFLVA